MWNPMLPPERLHTLAPVPAVPRYGATTARRRIGVLGGSFNPPHHGHLHISLEALRRLGLDEVWWLVAPQNPLKPRVGMAPLAERMTAARHLTRQHRRIKVLDLEVCFATLYSVKTLRYLRQRCPRSCFVWLMGTDNLLTAHRWKHWPRLFAENHIAVFDRPPYLSRRRHAKAALRFARRRVPEQQARLLLHQPSPAWTLLHCPQRLVSSTVLRQYLLQLKSSGV
jgi:nicotinate-nucleotide adenylyltransferase